MPSLQDTRPSIRSLLDIAQPALSQQIKVLETARGIRLFHRVRRGIELTEAGRAFLPQPRAGFQFRNAERSVLRASQVGAAH